MWIYSLICFVLAAGLSLLLMPLFRTLGNKMQIYSLPGGRHINKSPVPRLGGAPIFISFLVTFCGIFYIKDLLPWNLPPLAEQSQLAPLLCCAIFVWLLGLLDDIHHLRALYKLLAQIAIATGAYSLGLQIHAINFSVLGTLNLGDFSLPFTVLWIVGIINAINFIDGVDGLCSSVVICSFLGILCLAIFSGADTGAIICFAMIGATLGFLVFNSPPASIFLGDSGAYFLGFMIAALPIFISSKSASPGLFHVAFIIFLIIPFIDTSLAIYRRLIMSVPLSTPDRGHLHHRLLDKGYSYTKTTTIISFVSLVLVISGVMVAVGNFWQTALSLLAALAAVCVLLYLCGINSLKSLKLKNATNVTKAVLLKEYAPSFFHELVGAADWTQAQKILSDFTQNTEMCTASITCIKNGIHKVAWEWSDELSSPGRRKLQLCKTCNVFHDDVCYQFYYCWDSEYSHTQNDTDALLDVISKTVGKSCHEKFFFPDAAFENSNRIYILDEPALKQPPMKLAEKRHAC